MVYRPVTLNATFCFMVLTSHVLSLEAAGADYQRDVKGVFSERCFACHGALKQEADFIMMEIKNRYIYSIRAVQ